MAALHVALFLLSLAIIGFQIAFMQILSHLQWHHFAAQVISVALLGFGASGTLLAIARPWFLAHSRLLLPLLLMLCALGMACALPAGQNWFGQFDAQLLAVDSGQFWLLLATQAALLLPMLCGALVIGLSFMLQTERIGTLYFANLLGSACGGLSILCLMWWLPAHRLPGVCALITLAAAAVLSRSTGSHWPRWLAPLAGGAVIATVALTPAPTPSQYKPISYALALPQAIESQRFHSPYGLLQQVDAPALRWAPELSLAYHGAVPNQAMVFHLGDALGPAQDDAFDATAHLYAHSPRALAYTLSPTRDVLVLRAGTGAAARYAQSRATHSVLAQQAHPGLPAFLASSPLGYPAVPLDWDTGDARALLTRTPRRFDLILLPDVGQPGGDAGLGALTQDYLLTAEGLNAAWNRLSARGRMQVSVWIDQPLRQPLRLVNTLVAALEQAGVDKPSAHLAAVRSWSSLTLLVSRTPLSATDQQRIRAFSKRLQLDLALLPGVRNDERDYFHALNESALNALLDRLVSGERLPLQEQYPFDISTPSDNRPFFFHTPLQHRQRPAEPSTGIAPARELGYELLLLSFYQLLAASMLLIALPLALHRRSPGTPAAKKSEAVATGVYFAAIGLGFMCFEIALLHQLVFYFGQPVFAAAGAISVLLLFSGLGSYSTACKHIAQPGPAGSALWVAALIGLVGLLLQHLRPILITWEPAPRVATLCLLLAAPGLMMGRPFPLAMQQLSAKRPSLLPWAWAVNGCASVLAVPIATLAALRFGFSSVLIIGALCYLCATVLGRSPSLVIGD